MKSGVDEKILIEKEKLDNTKIIDHSLGKNSNDKKGVGSFVWK